jgi:CheY-like chemotaxis protein
MLVVDNDLGLQDLFRTFLRKIGSSRVAVGTAKDAIKSLRKQKFDLVFLDLQLPAAPGDQAHKTAKQIDPNPKVIVITGCPDSEILDRILQVSPVPVLKNSLKVEQLNQMVKIPGQKRRFRWTRHEVPSARVNGKAKDQGHSEVSALHALPVEEE